MAISEGLSIFIGGIPKQIPEDQLNRYLAPHLKEYGIVNYELSKGKNTGHAFLQVNNRLQGEQFLAASQNRYDMRLSPRFCMKFHANKKQDSGAKARDQKFAEEKMAQLESDMKNLKVTAPPSKPLRGKTFDTTTLSCGAWEYFDSEPVFVSYYTLSRPGRLLLGNKSLVALFDQPYRPGQWEWRIDFEYSDIQAIFTTGGTHSSVIITCCNSPKFYCLNIPSPSASRRGAQQNKTRVPCLNTDHGEVAGSCFSYELILKSDSSLRMLRDAFKNESDMPTVSHVRVRHRKPLNTFSNEMKALTDTLAIKWKWKNRPASSLPFCICFQVLKLAINGKLPPASASALARKLPGLLEQGITEVACANGVRQLYKSLERILPFSPAEDYSVEKLLSDLKAVISSLSKVPSKYQIVKTHSHLQLVHHVRVTPSGIYLEGPIPEVSNRVTRKHADNVESFARVTFSDEDGQRMEFQFNTNMDKIYERFQGVLNSSILICGKEFQFLGFSQSSMKSQTAWFMASFFDIKQKQVFIASQVVENIGDFTEFRSPAKCAARIGQAFTDTNGFVTIQAGVTAKIGDVERLDSSGTKRCFSDGCATVSAEIIDEIVGQYPRLSLKIKPVVFQIRYQGVKGVLSLDPVLPGKMLSIRHSMWKFGAKDANELEICGMADKPRPLFLNRPLIKVLEDLGVPSKGILDLAQESITELQQIASSVINITSFLERERIGESAGLSGLIRRLNDIEIDVHEDQFLSRVIEMAAVVHMRDLKYKGRIRVKDGVKLIGIMDETGFLKENEIHCAWIDPQGHRVAIKGKVAITRSPTNHPGDVQLVRAVEVPTSSPLHELYNCVIFSQHGERDLPSQLGGGDLDGDLYDIFWDPRLMPRVIYPAADYARPTPINIGRKIETTDITTHFVDYMKTDAVGLLSSTLLVCSDRVDLGTKDPQSIEISKLISDALDFPKTGIKPDMSKMPRIDKSLKPDFMAPSPHVKIDSYSASIQFLSEEVKNPHDAVASLDPDARKTFYYESSKVLGHLYRKVDEKGFYETLREDSRNHILIDEDGSSTMERLLAYVLKASQGLQYSHYLELARDIRHTYEYNVEDSSHCYALHSAHPLHEVEVVTGCALGSVHNRRLRDLVNQMREHYARDVAYARLRMRMDDNEDVDEALPRSIACLYVAVKEPGKKTGYNIVLKSFAYVAAAVCLEELEKFHGGLLKRFKVGER